MAVITQPRDFVVRRAKRVLDNVDERRVPSELRARFTEPSAVGPKGRKVAAGPRLARNRTRVVPWLASTRPLVDEKILEIGIGTGPGTVSLAEQGAHVTGLDPRQSRLDQTRARLDSHGLTAELVRGRAVDLGDHFGAGSFSWVVLRSCLQHLMVAERLQLLEQAWKVLADGGLLTVLETPNRLWYFDSDTSVLPYFHWLPDELAAQYLPFSPLDDEFDTFDPESRRSMREFVRLGRGVSFHEFDLAIAPVDELDVVACAPIWLRERNGLRRAMWRTSRSGRYEALLGSITPWAPRAFLQPTLTLTIEKPVAAV